jgi:hypothetical protein
MATKLMMRQFELTCRTADAPEHGSSRACLARARRPGSKSSRSNCGWENRFRGRAAQQNTSPYSEDSVHSGLLSTANC